MYYLSVLTLSCTKHIEAALKASLLFKAAFFIIEENTLFFYNKADTLRIPFIDRSVMPYL